jgi:hypothetical protein
MDHKERWQVSRLHNQIEQGVFSEEDIFALLMLLRRHSPKDSSICECADFIAHREKDRGKIFKYIEKTKGILNNIANNNIKVNTILDIKPVFSLAEIKTSLNSCLKRFDLAALSENLINQVLICIISLLQYVRLVKKNGKPIGVLDVAVSKAEIILLGKVYIDSTNGYVTFPVLVAVNNFMNVPEASGLMILNDISWARFQSGVMSLVQPTGGTTTIPSLKILETER